MLDRRLAGQQAYQLPEVIVDHRSPGRSKVAMAVECRVTVTCRFSL
jgi:hypothetical protein